MAVFYHQWRTRLRQGSVLLLVLILCFMLIDQTKSEVILINRASHSITMEEVFVGNKVANAKMEPYGFECIHTKESDILLNHVLGPNSQIRRRFHVGQWRLFRVAYIESTGSGWSETGAVHYWGNRMTAEFTDTGLVLKPGQTALRGWLERNRNWIPGSRWLD